MMNEESRLEPGRIIEQANEAIRILHEANSRLEASRAPMTALIDDNTLVTRAINLLKQKKRDTRRIIDALILANLTDIRDYQRLIALVSQVDGNINGRLTLLLLNQTENNINFTGQRLDRARRNLNSQIAFPHLATMTDQALRNMIRQYERALGELVALRNHLNSRIELFNHIELESRLLFKEADELRDHAMNGFEMIHQASADLPNSFSHPGLSEWRSTLETKKENLDDIRIAQAEGVLALLRDQGVSFPEDWSEEEKLEFAHRYVAEMRFLQAFMNENFPLTDFGTNYQGSLDFQNRERIAWFFLSDVRLAFHLDFQQRVALKDVLANTTRIQPVEEFFVNLGYNGDRERNTHLLKPKISFNLFNTSEANELASHASIAYRAAEQGTTTNEWFSSMVAIGIFEGVVRVGSLPRSIRQAPQQQTGQQNKTKLKPNEVQERMLNDKEQKPRKRHGVVTNEEFVRDWYTEQVDRILLRLDKRKPLEHQARQASELRNTIRTQARQMMSDGSKVNNLNETRPHLTWEQVINKYSKSGFSGDTLWKEIIEASIRSNPEVNKKLGAE